MIPISRSRRPIFGVAALVFFLILFGKWQSRGRPGDARPGAVFGSTVTKGTLPCQNLYGADDTVVILKTGSTELEAKLPVHIKTTLRCYSNRLIFSDASEVFQGEQIIDALESISADIKDTHPDFELYRQVRDQGRGVLTSGTADGSADNGANESHAGRPDNPGWKLDKWKFLPMMNRTLHEYPNKKWYIFVEADTYVLWGTLLALQSTLDPETTHYTGVGVMVGGIPFLHGGSGFFVSRSALQRITRYYTKHQGEIESFTDQHWAGDCVLGKTFLEAGVVMVDQWPIFQGDYPGMVPYVGPDGRPRPVGGGNLWCSPTASYHHMEPAMVEDLWNWEQLTLSQQKERSFLRHEDVFRGYITPRMAEPRSEWDNESEFELGRVTTLSNCLSLCEAAPECVQYSLRSDGSCRTFNLPRLGKASSGVQSAWMMDRIERVVKAMEPC